MCVCVFVFNSFAGCWGQCLRLVYGEAFALSTSLFFLLAPLYKRVLGVINFCFSFFFLFAGLRVR